MILSDSLMRPVLQGLVKVPENYMVNCSPGATFEHLAREMNGVGVLPSIKYIYVVCGTNYLRNGTGTNFVMVNTHMQTLHQTLVEKSSPGVMVRS